MNARFAHLTSRDFCASLPHREHRQLVLAACDAVQVAVAAGDQTAVQIGLMKLKRLTSNRHHSRKFQRPSAAMSRRSEKPLTEAR